MNILTLSWKNIISKPLHTALSVILFALSIGLIVFLALLNHQLKNGLDRNLAEIDLVIGAKGSPLQLILSSMYHIDAPTGNITIDEAAPFLNPKHPLIAQAIPLSLGDSYKGYRIVGTTPSILQRYNATSLEGELYTDDYEVTIGAEVARQLHLHLGDEFVSSHGIQNDPDMDHEHGHPFRIVGILNKTGSVLDQLILCTPRTIWNVHEHDTLAVNESQHDHELDHAHAHHHGPMVNLDSIQIAGVTDSILSQFKTHPDKEITSILVQYRNKTNIQSLNLLRNINLNTGLMAASPALEINRLYALLGSGTKAIGYLALLIATVAAISIFISLYTSLKERKYEMALLRVSGASPGLLFRMILGEGLWISISGTLIGLILGHGGMQLAGGLLEKGYRFPFTGWIWVTEEYRIMLLGIVIGVLASILPAIQGSRTDLHRTLAEG